MSYARKVRMSNARSLQISCVAVSLIFAAPIVLPGAFTVSAAEAGAGPSVPIETARPSLAVIIPADGEYPHSSLLFTVADIVFFSYENRTMLELYDSGNTLIWNNGGSPLDKGGHAHVSVPQGVYRARGSEKFVWILCHLTRTFPMSSTPYYHAK